MQLNRRESLFVSELRDLARQAYLNCEMYSRLSLVKEKFIASLTDNFTQRLCSIENDALLERLVHIIEKSEQFNQWWLNQIMAAYIV